MILKILKSIQELTHEQCGFECEKGCVSSIIKTKNQKTKKKRRGKKKALAE